MRASARLCDDGVDGVLVRRREARDVAVVAQVNAGLGHVPTRGSVPTHVLVQKRRHESQVGLRRVIGLDSLQGWAGHASICHRQRATSLRDPGASSRAAPGNSELEDLALLVVGERRVAGDFEGWNSNVMLKQRERGTLQRVDDAIDVLLSVRCVQEVGTPFPAVDAVEVEGLEEERRQVWRHHDLEL